MVQWAMALLMIPQPSIQCWLWGGANPSRVILPTNYNFLISSPLVMYSNTILDARGATITEKAGSNCNLLNNLGVTANRSGSDASVTSGNATVSIPSANFTAADVGSSISINGAGIVNAKLVTTISSVVDSTHVVLTITPGSTVSNQPWSIYRRDTNLEVWGGTWDRASNAGSGTLAGNGLHFRHLDNLYIHDLTYTMVFGKNSIAVGDITKYTCKNITLVHPGGAGGYMDGIHVVGPASRVRIENIKGETGDDFVALTPADYQAFGDTVGDITDVDISGLFPSGSSFAAFKLIGGYGVKSRSIRVAGIHGSTSRTAITIWDDTSGPNDTDGVVIEDVDCVPGSGYFLAQINCTNGKSIKLKDLYWRQNLATQDVIKLDGIFNLVNLAIDGLTIENGTSLNLIHATTAGTLNTLSLSKLRILSSSVTAVGIQVDSTATINRVIFNDVDGIMANNSNALLSVAGHVTRSTFNNVNLKGGAQLLSLASTADAMTTLANNIILDGAYQIAATSVALTMSLTNCYATPSQSQLFNLTGASANLTIMGRGLINPNNVTCFVRDGTQTPRIIHPEMQVNTTTIAANLGDTAYNTNGSAPTGTGPVIYNGTSWQPVASPMTTAGDTVYGGTNGAATRLAAGTTSQVLIGGTTPSWGSVALASMASGTLGVANGGTGQTTYTDGQLLIGNSTGNTLSKATLTGTTNRVTVTNAGGSITLSGPQDLATGSSPTFLGATLSDTVSASEKIGLTLSNLAGAANSNIAISLRPGNLSTGRAKIVAEAPGSSNAYLSFYTSHANGAPVKQLFIDDVGNLNPTDGTNIILGTTTGMKIGTATSQKVGFYNATPVIQQATTGTSTGFTAGAGTTATSTSTFTGGTGTTAYTVGDIVLALKNLGLLAA